MPRWGRRHGITSNHQSLRPDAPSSVQMSWEFPASAQDRIRTRGPKPGKAQTNLFSFLFFRGELQEWDMYIYIYVYVRRYIYIYLYYMYHLQYLSSPVVFFNHPWTGFATMVLQLPDTGRELDGIQPSRSKTVQLEAPLGVAARGEQCSKPWFLWIGGVLPKQW